MALSTSPRKVIPLATGDETRHRQEPISPGLSTKRVFFCGVVVEGSESGRRLPEDANILSSEGDGQASDSNGMPRKRALTDSSALSAVISELVSTEKSYVRRLQILKNDYADPLRNFAKSKSTAILPAYEAKTLFGNIDNLLPVNEAFLTDLEKMMAPNGPKTVGGVGDVALRHFKQLRGFEQYKQYYVKREDAQMIFEREVSRRSSPFAAYIDRIKYQSADTKNRVGLRELLMDPVQRIPRYTLMFRIMIKHMSPSDPQRAKLIEADEIASKIALAETDEQTKRASIFYCLSSNIHEFPPDLFSNSRRFIDCIDVEDVVSDTPSSSSASVANLSAVSLHCSLILFDDKLLIVKRPGNGEKGCRVLAGLDDLDKVTKASGMGNGRRKNGMTCKGVVDITEVAAADVGGADFHLYLENPPQDQTDRWSNRPLRCLSVVHSPSSVNLVPSSTESDKARFLENLWNAQAKYRARAGQSVVLRSNEIEVDSKSTKTTVARTYYNVYQRKAFLQELKKTKIVVHIDANGSADRLPFGIGSPPFAIIRLQPLPGGVCRYKVTSSDPSDQGEEDIVQTARVPDRIILTIHQYGLFEFRSGRNSRPSTPTARSKASIFGLDVISRNLFNSRPASSVGDFFAGSINSHRRSKSTTSHSSTYTHTTTTGDDSIGRFSQRSTTTLATSVDDDSFRSKSSTKRSIRRGMSPANSFERGSSRSLSRASSSRSTSRGGDSDYSDLEDEDPSLMDNIRHLDASERNLVLQLRLARKNSKNQNERQSAVPLVTPSEEAIYEEEPPQPDPIPKILASHDLFMSLRIALWVLEAHLHYLPLKAALLLPSLSRETDSDSGSSCPSTPSRSTGIPRSRRQPFYPTGNTDATPRPHSNQTSVVEPLSIKKKPLARSATNATTTTTHSTSTATRSATYSDSGHSSHSSHSRPSSSSSASSSNHSSYPSNEINTTPVAPTRKTHGSPLSRSHARRTSPRRTATQIRAPTPAMSDGLQGVDMDEVLKMSCVTKEDLIVRSSESNLKLRTFVLQQPKRDGESISRPSSPVKGFSTPQRPPPLTKAAQERLNEMRTLISQRTGDNTPVNRARNSVFDTPFRSATPVADNSLSFNTLDSLISDAEGSLSRGISNCENLKASLDEVPSVLAEKTRELEKSKVEAQNIRRQCEVMKSLLDDATTEREILYEAFNEELDGMFNDVNLPEDEAWIAMSNDLRKTKEARNALSKENSYLKRQLAEAELKQEEWATLLRSHGLIP
ncbi:uncharacterized protein EV420DRAFT_1635453 [Desarmillaria tabescens]|uniref:DH domain-containing protein n=1 Tax=Armillaria tabescens TaxID=1929756 RepID=A0AA39NM61_ARMTA|nr:uncharacterized protein EV420DRAFT_1635453 [Desarmillaria tabescens]KAK0468197.1 hypothetical protein EV420DRAFT_1635453 [Desarmillaria tabescens]